MLFTSYSRLGFQNVEALPNMHGFLCFMGQMKEQLQLPCQVFQKIELWTYYSANLYMFYLSTCKSGISNCQVFANNVWILDTLITQMKEQHHMHSCSVPIRQSFWCTMALVEEQQNNNDDSDNFIEWNIHVY